MVFLNNWEEGPEVIDINNSKDEEFFKNSWKLSFFL